MTLRSPEAVLSQVPGWEGSTLREMSGGLTNRTWLVEKAGNRAVLKIDDEVRGAPYSSRADEAAVQLRAASGGLANAVLYADETTLMTEYVDGNVWEPGCLEKVGNIERLARALRQLHALPLSGRTFDATVAARRYAAEIQGRDARIVAHCRQTIESMRQPHNLCC